MNNQPNNERSQVSVVTGNDLTNHWTTKLKTPAIYCYYCTPLSLKTITVLRKKFGKHNLGEDLLDHLRSLNRVKTSPPKNTEKFLISDIRQIIHECKSLQESAANAPTPKKKTARKKRKRGEKSVENDATLPKTKKARSRHLS